MKNIKRLMAVVIITALVLAGCTQLNNQKAESVLQDGTYTAEAKSHGGPLTVEMTCKDGKITDLKILSHSDDEDYAQKAVENLPQEIIKAQSLGVDVTAGATMTSRSILGAAAQCVRDAGGNAREFGYVPTGEIADSQAITIMGLSSGEAVISGEKIKTYEPVKSDTVSINASGESTPTVCKGVLLETLLNELGTSQKDYGSIIVTATDGYSIEIPTDVLQSRDIIIAYEVNGEECDLRTIIPDERAMYWVKFIDTVELLNRVQEEQTSTVIFGESVYGNFETTEYKYNGSIDTAIAMADILDYMGEKTDFVTLTSTDSWGKDDKWDVVRSQYFKITGEDAPMFVGPDLPEGMRLKKTLSVKTGSKCLLSYDMAAQKLKEVSFVSNDKEYTGVKLSEIFAQADMAESDKYTFVSQDGYSISIDKGDIEKGYVLRNDQNNITVRFVGLDKSTTVKQLVSVEAEG